LLVRGLTGLLHDVQPADPVTLGVVAALLSCIGLIAAYLPARRATRLNALDALRHEYREITSTPNCQLLRK
jgi:putative ABC transport system permease protein